MLAKCPQRLVPFFGLTAVLLLSLSMPAMGAPGDTELISTAPGSSDHPAISRDGRYVVFQRSGHGIQRHDRLTGATERVDRGIDGQAPNADGELADLSADGRFVTFVSKASNMVLGDANVNGSIPDIFVRDMQTGSTARASVGPHGEEANGWSSSPHVSADGRFVAFLSYATNLVAGDTARGDVFMWDRQTGVVERITIGEYGEPANDNSAGPLAISEDGRYVAFASSATNLIEGFCCDSVYVRDRWLGLTEPASVTADGRPPNGSTDNLGLDISADGRFVVFPTHATDLIPNAVVDTSAQVVLRDRATGLYELVSQNLAGASGNQSSWHPHVSADGRFVVFESDAYNLVPGDTFDTSDVFVRDRLTGSTQRVSVNSAGTPSAGEWESFVPRISADGRFVVFATSRKLSPLDTDNERDVYVHEIAVVEPGTFSYELTPQAISFGVQTLATSRTQNFSLRNTGTTALPMGSVTLAGANPAAFSLTHYCPAWMAVGTGCAIKVTFKPTGVRDKSALVKVVVGNSLTTTRPVSGTGVRARDTVLPTSLSFGDQDINTTSAGKYVTVTNIGAGVLPIKSIYLSGQNAKLFVRTHNCPAYVPVGGSCTVRVYFKPWSVGAKTATLTVWGGGGAGPKTAALSGTGTAPPQ